MTILARSGSGDVTVLACLDSGGMTVLDRLGLHSGNGAPGGQ